jgi:hypothetical protein
MRERLHQLEFRRFDERYDPLCDLLIVERVFHFVPDSSTAAVDGQLEIDHDRLFDTALPIDKANDAFDGEAAKKNGVGHI